MMQRYSLAKLAGRPRGTTRVLPPIAPRLAMEKQMIKLLRAIATQLAKETREGIIPAYAADLQAKRLQRSYTGDVEQSWFIRLRRVSIDLQEASSAMVRRILDLEGRQHTEAFKAAAKKALGVDLSAVVRQEDIQSYLELAVTRNVSLIRSLTDDTVKRVEQTVIRNALAGKPASALRKDLAEQFGIVGRRADLIARDQTAKFSSDLNQIRQQQAGVASYTWSTSHDERVRPLHASLDGREYKWDEETDAEGGLHPGQPVNCRCVALARVEF